MNVCSRLQYANKRIKHIAKWNRSGSNSNSSFVKLFSADRQGEITSEYDNCLVLDTILSIAKRERERERERESERERDWRTDKHRTDRKTDRHST